VYQLTRVRIASAGSPIQQLTIRRDNEATRACIQQRRADILCANRANAPPHRRFHFTASQRLEIIQLMRLADWNIEQTAANFVVHPNTIRAWIQAIEGNGRTALLDGAMMWNKIDDAVRWAVQELRSLFPEKEFGTRTIAGHLVRAGIQLSRSTVQRVLREPMLEKPPRKPRPAMKEPAGVKPHGLLKPKKTDHVWHSDITQIRVLWFTFFVAAILDGFSRKILALKVYRKTPCARNMGALVRNAAASHGSPKYIITDNGSQFRKQFGKAMRRQRICQIRTRVRSPFLNGKIERFFRTFKLWQRLMLMAPTAGGIQRRLDGFACWYNIHRPHSDLGHKTPAEAFSEQLLTKPVTYRARDNPNIQIEITRRHYRGDPHLSMPEITVHHAA
jgi:putative transposase